MSLVGADIRYGWRMLRRSPVYTVIGIITLALAIGVATAIVSLADALFLRPVAGAAAADVIELAVTTNGQIRESATSYDEYAHFRDNSTALRGLAAHYSASPLELVNGDGSREINGAVVSASYFPLLGVRPALGRFFSADEDVPRSPSAVVVLSHDFWVHQYREDPDIIGRSIEMNGVGFTVIGIAPQGFHGVDISRWNDVWIPMSMLPTGYRWCDDAFAATCTMLHLFGRLRPGITMTRASAELNVLARQLDAGTADRAARSRYGMRIRQLRGQPAGYGRRANAKSIALLLGAAGLLLVIACTNLAGTLLARNAARSREIAIRLSIGAGPGRVSRQLLTEAIMLSLMGGLAGIVVALWSQQLLAALWTADLEGYVHHLDVRLNSLALGFAVALSLLSGLAFGLLPSLRTVRMDPIPSLKGERQMGRSRFTTRDVLIAVQIALSFPAIALAGLLAGSLRTVYSGAGFDIEHVALMRLRPRLVDYDATRARSYELQVLRQLSAVPGVRAASLVGEFGGVWGNGDEAAVWLPASPPLADSLAPRVRFSEVAPRFFETLGVTVLEGREFDQRDDVSSERVAIVNQTFVRRFLRGGAVGQTIVVNGGEVRVIGVIGDAHFRNAGEAAMPFVYGAWLQDSTQVDARLAVRVTGDPQALLPDLVRAARAVDPTVPVTEVLTLRAQIEAAFNRVRLTGGTLFWAAVLAIALCALAVYGALSFAVSARRRELAIRKAIGAGRADIARTLAGRMTAFAGGGLAVGLLLALGSTRLIANLVYGVGLANPLIFVASGILLALVVVVASWVPAHNAMRVQPRETLVQT